MQYPKFLKKNGSIGLVAPSFGCTTFPYKDKLNTAIKTLKEKGRSEEHTSNSSH